MCSDAVLGCVEEPESIRLWFRSGCRSDEMCCYDVSDVLSASMSCAREQTVTKSARMLY